MLVVDSVCKSQVPVYLKDNFEIQSMFLTDERLFLLTE